MKNVSRSDPFGRNGVDKSRNKHRLFQKGLEVEMVSGLFQTTGEIKLTVSK